MSTISGVLKWKTNKNTFKMGQFAEEDERECN